MAFCQLHWFSEVLGKQTTTWVLIPEKLAPPFATFYLLHGLSDDQSAWIRHTRINDYAADLPLIVVMPDGGRSFYTDHDAGPRWATHLAEELPRFIERTFPAKHDRGSRCIGGLSMGGYGALRLGLGYPDRYCSVTSHSGALGGPSRTCGSVSMSEYDQMVAGPYEGSEHDLIHLAKRASVGGQLPRLRIDCGTDDFLLQENRNLHQTLTKLNIPHEYEEFPGNHNWAYWEAHITEALAFHSRNLGIS